LLAWHTWTVFYQTYGPLPAACGPFSFSRTFYMLWVNLFPSFADRSHSSGPRVDFTGHSRFTCGPFSPREDLFQLLAWHTWTVFYQTYEPLPTACGPFLFSRTFYMLCVDLRPSLAHRFHSSGSRLDFSDHSRFACGPYSPRADLFLLLAWHRWTVFYQTYGPLPSACGPFSFSRTFYMLWANLFPSLADRFYSSGPRVDFSGHSRFACGPFSPRADLFLLLVFLSNVWTSARRVRTFFVLADLLYVMGGPLSLACGPLSFIRTPSGLFWSLALR